jgi:hypothetical protein
MEGQSENEELYPIAVLIDELKVGTGSTWICYLKTDVTGL